jgi:hypothetical protein
MSNIYLQQEQTKGWDSQFALEAIKSSHDLLFMSLFEFEFQSPLGSSIPAITHSTRLEYTVLFLFFFLGKAYF